jgi:hypothetical protein
MHYKTWKLVLDGIEYVAGIELDFVANDVLDAVRWIVAQ